MTLVLNHAHGRTHPMGVSCYGCLRPKLSWIPTPVLTGSGSRVLHCNLSRPGKYWPAPRQDAIQVTVYINGKTPVTTDLPTKVVRLSSLEIRPFIVHNGL